MQGIVFDIKRFAVHDGPGIRTTVFFKGCPLRCRWCHNPESIDIHPGHFTKKITLDGSDFEKNETIGISASVSELVELIKKDFIFMEESGGGVTFSGGEPTLQPEFLISLLKACKEEGIHTAVDTCGYSSRLTLTQILPFTDLFLFDLKQLDSEKHLEGTGQHNDVIIDNLIFLIDSGKPIHLRIPVIPGFNYSEYDLVQVIKFLNNFKGRIDQVDLLPYHTIAKNKYKRFGIINKMDGTPGLKKEDLFNFAELFRKEGFTVKIGG